MNSYHPAFHPARRPDAPNYAQAVADQGYLNNQRAEIERKKRNAQLKAPLDMYESYVNLTDHNPISDVLRGTGLGKNSPSVQEATRTRMLEDRKLEKEIGGLEGVSSDTGGGSPPVNKPPVDTSMAGGPPPVPKQTVTPPGGVGASPTGGPPMAGGPPPVINMAGGTAASTSVQGGKDSLAAALEANNAAKTASTGANVASAGSKVVPAAGAVLGAGMGYADAKQRGGDDAAVIGKTLGGAAPAGLMAYSAPLAAAGPIGWAGIAGLAALSLYGMLG